VTRSSNLPVSDPNPFRFSALVRVKVMAGAELAAPNAFEK
jgi:hypothetical protein